MNIQHSENQYHSYIKTGSGLKSATHEYSEEFVQLLIQIRDDEEYQLDL